MNANGATLQINDAMLINFHLKSEVSIMPYCQLASTCYTAVPIIRTFHKACL